MNSNKDALEALEKLRNVIKYLETAGATGEIESYLSTIRTALSHTYNPATHLLIAREDHASLLRFKFCLYNAYKYCVFNEDRATPKNIMEAIEQDLGEHMDALIAQKMEE